MDLFAIIVLVFAHIYTVQSGTVEHYGLCTQTSDCIPDVGLSCVHFWTPCGNGTCDCSDEQVWDENRCQPKLYIGSDCTASRSTEEITDATCVNGTVACNNGFTEVEKRCRQGTKELGDDCSTIDDCYIKNSDCRRHSNTSPKTCVCAREYRNVSNKCQKAQIGEACTFSGDCESPSKMVCTNRTCECISSRVPYDGQCKENGPKPVNETCTEGSGDCKLGLSCKRCPGESQTRCLRKVSRDSDSTASVNEACSSTSDCIVQVGLTCTFPHPTCSTGTCQCSETNIWDLNKCQPKLYIGSTITVTRTLPPHMIFTEGQIKCIEGYTAVGITECLAGTKSLGEECGTSSDCYVINSDCRIGTGGTRKTCICETNYKHVESICRKAYLDEACSVVEDCVSDTMICGSSKTCTCKSTLKQYGGICVATGTAKLNETCGTGDSTNCVLGLSCTSCPDETERRCQELPTPTEYPAPNPSPVPAGAELVVPVAVNILLAVGLALLGKKTVL